MTKEPKQVKLAHIAARVTAEEKQRVDEVAEARGLSISEIILAAFGINRGKKK
jgi:uncharacterized protein (DUF1778 family)